MRLNIDKQKLSRICDENNIDYLALFGSYARGEAKKDSDIDLLVRFKTPIGYFKLVQVQDTLKDFLGKEVDLVTENALSKYIKPYVYKDLTNLYVSKTR